jgi:hypothetical protein
MFPGEIMPVPPPNTPVRLADPPAAIEAGVAAKLVIVGAVEVTVTVAVLVAVTPAEFVTVRV